MINKLKRQTIIILQTIYLCYLFLVSFAFIKETAEGVPFILAKQYSEFI